MATVEGLKRAQTRAVDGPYPDYAQEVRRLLGYFGGRALLSLRAAEGKTGVKHTTIGTMARGFRADAYNTRCFAESLGGNADNLLKLGGHLVENDDPLSPIGSELDMRQFTERGLAETTASAGPNLLNGATGPETETVGSVIHGDVRAICVEGDCMEPFYHHGEVLFVLRADTAEYGSTVIAILDGDVVACKVFRQGSDGDFLEARNGHYDRITGSFRIVGIVKGSYKP